MVENPLSSQQKTKMIANFIQALYWSYGAMLDNENRELLHSQFQIEIYTFMKEFVKEIRQDSIIIEKSYFQCYFDEESSAFVQF